MTVTPPKVTETVGTIFCFIVGVSLYIRVKRLDKRGETVLDDIVAPVAVIV